MTPDQQRFIKSLEQAGKLLAEDVVSAAEPTDSPIHPLFDWDNESAGPKYRLEQARGIIVRIRMEVINNRIELRCPVYVKDPTVSKTESGYASINSIKTKESSAQAALQNELLRIEALVERGRMIASGLDLRDQFEARLATMVSPLTVVPNQTAAAAS